MTGQRWCRIDRTNVVPSSLHETSERAETTRTATHNIA